MLQISQSRTQKECGTDYVPGVPKQVTKSQGGAMRRYNKGPPKCSPGELVYISGHKSVASDIILVFRASFLIIIIDCYYPVEARNNYKLDLIPAPRSVSVHSCFSLVNQIPC